MKQVFVTGGSGFVGRNLIEALVSRGVAVRALARSDAAVATVESIGAESVRGDLDAKDVMASAMAGCDVVFHAAAQVTLWGDPEVFHRVNVVGTENVTDAAKAAFVPRLVHVSTEAVLAGGRPIVDAEESWPYPSRPAGLYPLTKGQAEQRVIAANSDGLATVAVRPPLIWGAGDTSVLPQLIEAVKSGQWVWIGGGQYPHTTTHVANVVEGLLLAAEKGRGGEIYFLSDGEPMEFRTFVTALLSTQGVEAKGRSMPYWAASAIASLGEGTWKILGLKSQPPLPRTVLYVMGQALTVRDDKARRELGYEGRMGFAAGFQAMREAGPLD